MRAVVCHELGEPDVLTFEDVPTPEPGPTEVLIEPQAYGLNFVDVLMVAGGYQLKPELPFVPGLEAAGIVRALGGEVEGVKAGDRVIFGKRPGAFAEQVVAEGKTLLAMPDGMSFEQAACFRSAFSTALQPLKESLSLTPC